jgi:signal transduction histidine kinase/CheY-like chemotaxis protein
LPWRRIVTSETPNEITPTAGDPARNGEADDSRRQRHDRHVAQGEERLRRIIDSIADAVVLVDGDGTVKVANPAAAALFGQRREELIGDHFGLPLVAGETTEVDLKSGAVAEMRTVEILWEDEPACLATLRDVTARKEAEETARRLWQERTAREEAEKERGRLEELLVRAPAAILTTRGGEQVCAFANPPMTRLVGDRELEGRRLAEALSDLAGQGFVEGFEATFREGVGRSQVEMWLHVGEGGGNGDAERCLDVTWEPLLRRGSVDGVLCFAYDVTEQVATRRELESTMARLREEERAKDQFLAVLGHELRNPLAGIDSGLQLLEKVGNGEASRWPLEMMRKQVRVLAGLLDDLFDVSAVSRGKLELQKQVLPLADVVDSAVAAVHGRFEEREQHLAISLPDEPVSVEGDVRRLGQVLANLLGNASKYSPAGTRVELRVASDGEEVTIEVEDEGAGIAPEMIDEIFEPFVQVGSSSPAAGGLGIGLTLVRQLVELHGGSVSAASPGLGAGSTFTVRLPAAAHAEAAASREAPAEDVVPFRVLVVDDHEDAGRALAELLALRGCDTDTATTGTEGIEKARATSPQVILLDLDLPDLSGYDVAARLRADDGRDRPLIVAISGFGDEQARSRSKGSGIDHHFVKPVDLERLLEVLNRHSAGQR